MATCTSAVFVNHSQTGRACSSAFLCFSDSSLWLPQFFRNDRIFIPRCLLHVQQQWPWLYCTLHTEAQHTGRNSHEPAASVLDPQIKWNSIVQMC